MRAPSLKAIRAAFSHHDGEEYAIRAICKARDNPDVLRAIIEGDSPYAKATDVWVRQMHSDPYRSQMWRTSLCLHLLNSVMGTYGVETLGKSDDPPYAPPCEYLNAGDAYATTLIYKRETDTLSIGAWGDIAECMPEEDPDA